MKSYQGGTQGNYEVTLSAFDLTKIGGLNSAVSKLGNHLKTLIPAHKDELIKTADDVYLRFHGTTKWYRHDYTNDELDVWAARVRSAARPISGRTSTTTEKRAPSGTLTRFVSFWKSLDGQHEEASGRRQAPNRAPWDPKPTRRPPSSC